MKVRNSSECGWVWANGNGWWAANINCPCVIKPLPPWVMNEVTKIQCFDRILTDDEIKEIHKRWTESEDA